MALAAAPRGFAAARSATRTFSRAARAVDCWGEEHLFVRPAELEQQLQYLSENGYETIFFEDLAHLERYEKPVILTFDDGYDDNYTLLLPLLQKYHMKATIFMIAGDIGGPTS